uniref:Cytochrome n=1 Tax=Lutzomyia longipalpis TaxID=7200 RepID=A0A1B0CT03_LUTLO
MSLLLLLIFLLFCVIFLQHLWLKREVYWLSWQMPGPFLVPLIGHLQTVRGISHGGVINLFKYMMKNYKSPLRWWIGTKMFVIVKKPEDMQIILNSPQCLSRAKVYKFFKSFVGDGILILPVSARMFNPFLQCNWIFRLTKLYKVEKLSSCITFGFVDKILQKKKTNFEHTDELKTLKSTVDDDLPLKTPQIFIDQLMKLLFVEKKFNDYDVISEANTIVASGFESIALASSYCILMLAMHPEHEQRLYNEIKTIMEDRKDVHYDDFSKYDFLDSAGPRNCIGFQYAYILIKIILIQLVSNFKFRTDLKMSEFRLRMDISLQLINKHLVYVEKRK